MNNDIRKILVVSKSTKHCAKALHFGISLAKKYDAQLFVIHVIFNPIGGFKGWMEKELEKMFEDDKKDLDRIIHQEKAEGMDIQEILKEGDPEEEILKFVETEGIDLVVMRAYEEGRIEHLLFGRGRDSIIRKMPCSVLLVHDVLPTEPDFK
jgi:nucleotide-binding universal stress UspA family protein